MTDFSNIKIAKGFKDIDPYEFADTDAAKTMFAKSRANGGSTAAASEEPSSGKTNGRARVEEPVPPTPEPGNATPLPELTAGALTLEDFLRCVVPWPSADEPGFITIHNHLRDQPFLGKSCRSVDDALSTVANLKATTRHNIYFCISRQKLNSGHRDRENALRFCCIPIDLDIKRNSPKHYGMMSEALAALYNFCINHGIPKPSLIVRTGGGLHVYWLSDRVLTVDEWQPYANGLKAAAKAAGLKLDPTCTGDAARVLRVPGTLNYKYDPPRPVSLLQGPNLPNGDRHDFAAVFGKLLGKKATPLQQPKIEIAKGFKDLPLEPSGIEYDDTPLPFPPIKAGCAWLREAHDTGGKDHDQPQWHLAVLAATFLENGDELAHQLGNQHADYGRGEKTEEMWERKVRERKEKDLGWPSCKAIHDNGSTHCEICPRLKLEKSPLNIGLEAALNDNLKSPLLDPGDPLPSAAALVEATFTSPEGRMLHRHREAFWRYDGTCYRPASIEAIDGTIWSFLDRAVCLNKKGKIVRFKPVCAKVANVRAALVATCLLNNTIEAPAWLSATAMPPAEEFFACGNGLLHVPTGVLYPPTPDYFGVIASSVRFDPDAPQPLMWLRYLDQVLDDDEAITCLQDWMGYLLTSDTSQQKILFMEGLPRSGKGTWARIMAALLGKQSVAGPTMAQLSEHFGLEPLVTASLALISDARIGGRTDKSTIAERLLSISGEDILTVGRKHISAWTGKLPARIAILTNELPAFGENSGALVGRFIMLVFPHSFYGREDTNLTKKLMAELPGILNWSMVGYRRLRERGHFVQPKNALKKLEQIEMLSAPVKAFVRDCCKIGPGLEAGTDRLYQAWRTWCATNGGPVISKEWFSRNCSWQSPA